MSMPGGSPLFYRLRGCNQKHWENDNAWGLSPLECNGSNTFKGEGSFEASK